MQSTRVGSDFTSLHLKEEAATDVRLDLSDPLDVDNADGFFQRRPVEGVKLDEVVVEEGLTRLNVSEHGVGQTEEKEVGDLRGEGEGGGRRTGSIVHDEGREGTREW